MRVFKALFILALFGLLAYLFVSGKLSEAAANSSSETFKTLMARIDTMLGPTMAGAATMAAGGVIGFLVMIWPGRRRRR